MINSPLKGDEIAYKKIQDGGGGTADVVAAMEKPMSTCVWRFMLAFGVVIYGSFSIIVHLTEVDGKLPFSSTSLFLIVEFSKLCISIIFLYPELRQRGMTILPKLRTVIPFSIPALLYLITNNLGVHMQTEMDPATYQVLANMKIISTALLYRAIIKKPITRMQWYSLAMLAVAGALNSYGGINASPAPKENSASVIHITGKGLVMITGYCMLSGLAGVYNEYILKDKYEMSIHLQNTMLYCFGCMFNGTSFLFAAFHSANPQENLNLLNGFTYVTWILVATQATVGLIMSSIIKHGSNIVRLYFIACAMLVTTGLSVLLFGLHLNAYFCMSFVIVTVALYLNQKDTRVWIACKESVWKVGKVTKDYQSSDKTLLIACADNQTLELAVKGDDRTSFPPLRNPDILVGENDLTSLSYLHEPAVLYNLQVRFSERQDIYTYCGIVLVAINPYHQLEIYDEPVIQAYSGQDLLSMDPHIFAVAEDAFKNMSRFSVNQSLIVSGESGSGKTVSAKYAMRYFASVCGAAVVETRVEDKVLASNPIMEAIGNAKTTRNDNSSRFGKYIEIDFDAANTITGASMKTYLLEKSRVVYQASHERNYHIFYQLCASRNLDELDFLSLDEAEHFNYLNQGEDVNITNVNDADELIGTRESFTLLGICEPLQMEIFRVLAAILHLGNVEIRQIDEDSSEINCDDASLTSMVNLLGIDANQMRKWLCNRKIVTVGEVLVKPLNDTEASDARDALAKYIYASVFNWVVYELNKELYGGAVKQKKFIGVLDIYGFETFEVNSFEQFCINYANEKLQQQFCMHVFKLEQAEYVKEEISWSFIDFYDNQPCIELIEGKIGILGLLDEECRLAKGSNENWCQKLYTHHSAHVHFEKPRLSRSSFVVVHFADRVCYSIADFVEKNRDQVLVEHINILKASQYSLVAELFAEKTSKEEAAAAAKKSKVAISSKTPKVTGNKIVKTTVGLQFRESLKQLMATLTSTTPHYIRCIKPNDEKQAFVFDPHRAVQQLRACGVLETVRISAAGYPSRWLYTDFLQRYRSLVHSKLIVRNETRATCENIISRVIEEKDKYQFGKTKIFFRAGQVAYLESLRSRRLKSLVTRMQTMVRGWLARRRYNKIKKATLVLQTATRCLLARRLAQKLRETHACVVIQSKWKAYQERKRYLRVYTAIVLIQTQTRGLHARRLLCKLRHQHAATVLQSFTRGYLARKRYERILRGIIALQSHVRRRAARRIFKVLKVEARSVDHIKKVAKGLEIKIIELQQKLDKKALECTTVQEAAKRSAAKHSDMNRTQELSMQEKIHNIETLVNSVKDLKQEAEESEKKYEDVITKKRIINNEKDKLLKEMEIEKAIFNEKLKEYQETVEKQNKQIEDAVLSELALKESQITESEIEIERRHHQKLIKDHERLQQRYENLHAEVNTPTSPTGVPPRRSLSEVSLDSMISSNVSNIPDDLGYGSGRRRLPSAGVQQHQQQQIPTATVQKPLTSQDVDLISRLQHKVGYLEQILDDSFGLTSEDEDTDHEVYTKYEKQNINIENHRLKEEILLLRKGIADDLDKTAENAGFAAKELMNQFGSIVDELAVKRQECVQLRTLLSNHRNNSSANADKEDDVIARCYGNNELINEDGELSLAYSTQCELNKLMEKEMLKQKLQSDTRASSLTSRVDKLNAENKRQNEIISKNLSAKTDVQISEALQSEITRVVNENLDLRDRNHEVVSKLKKILHNKLQSKQDLDSSLTGVTFSQEMPFVTRTSQPRQYLGMFEYNIQQEQMLIKHLIKDLQPQRALQQISGLPMYIIFMCIRHTEVEDNDDKARSLLTNVINTIQSVVKEHRSEVETMTMWLSNTCRLLHILKQYSGDKPFVSKNTSKQMTQCLRVFNLSEYRPILSDLTIWIFQGLIKLIYMKLKPLIVNAVVETESIPNLSAAKPSGIRGRGEESKENQLSNLLTQLKKVLLILRNHSIDKELIDQIMKQLFYFICAYSFNNLLLRKDMCHWSKGMQIRYNMSRVEQWIHDNGLKDSGAIQVIQPIIQASKLLQSTKTNEDVNTIVTMCSDMTNSQIVKLLNLYTPVDEFEVRVPKEFIKTISDHLDNIRTDTDNATLYMDNKHSFGVVLPFVPSNVAMETLTTPPDWGLGFLKRI